MVHDNLQQKQIDEKIQLMQDMLSNLNFDSSPEEIYQLHNVSNEVVMKAYQGGADKDFVKFALHIVTAAEQKGREEQYPNLAMASIKTTKEILGYVAA